MNDFYLGLFDLWLALRYTLSLYLILLFIISNGILLIFIAVFTDVTRLQDYTKLKIDSPL